MPRSSHAPAFDPSLKGYHPHWSGPLGPAGDLRYCAARALWLAGLATAALLLRAAAVLL